MSYTLVRSRRRTLSLQVNQAGEVVARAPLFYPKFLIDSFVETKSRWISKRRAELSRPTAARTEYFSAEQLREFVHQQVAHFGPLMRLTPHSLRFTQVQSYWGTCSPAGVLSFNLALRFTPPEAVTYVVVHELAHLRYRGHGMRFWKLVNTTYPPASTMRSVLRKIGRLTTI